ncbi:MAG: TonB-dependent receptor [Opitutaceae bacterium]|nr:TonB-dependent receptor [Opitutaceae bacterium]
MQGLPLPMFAWFASGRRIRPSHLSRLAFGLFLLVQLGLRPTGALAQAPAAGTGSISGWVSNQATRNLLPGATVELPGLNRTTRTDDTGHYAFHGLPDGLHEVVAAYTDLDASRDTVTIRGGATVTRNFDLTSKVYRLGEFTVSADREGAAATLTAQRNANNVKNVIAMDSYSDLPNMSVAELAGLMPGVAVNFSDDGVASGIQVRGAPATHNRVTIDGGLKAGSGVTRAFSSAHYTGAGFAEVELTKGHRPDTGADSLGGTINLKSRSPLSMKERRRIDYSASVRYAAPFTKQVYFQQQHREHPLLNLGYQEVFDVAGGERNLGISVNAFYVENSNGLFVTDRLFQNTTDVPAFNYDYRVMDKYNNRKIYSGRFLTDFRLSPATTFRFIAGYVHNNEPNVHQYQARIFTNQVVGTTGTAGILPGYTDQITTARQVAATQVTTTDQMIRTYRHYGDLSLGAEHKYDRLTIDYTGAYSWNRWNRSTGKSGGNLVSSVSNVGWIVDRSESDLYPRFVQTGGLDVTNPANFRPSGNNLTLRNQDDYEEVTGFTGNARLQVFAQQPLFLKAGFDWREVAVEEFSRDRRYIYIGTSALPHDPSARLRSSFGIPHWHAGMLVRNEKPVSPELWRENVYFFEQQRYTGRQSALETVTAGYLMADGRFGNEGWRRRTSFLAGVRMEKTETEGRGYGRARVLSTAAQQAADPMGSAERDYAGRFRVAASDYTKSFPSVHLAHDITANMKARLSWSTSFGRPNMTNMFPNETPNETGGFVTVNNAGLLPQSSRNWDANLDYYFKPAGFVSVGWFHKTIKDYIVTGATVGQIDDSADNGFNGEYRGFELRSSINGGTATVRGIELTYQQQFVFLPGLLKGLSLMANYTALETYGDFGGTAQLSSGSVAGFVPRVYNLVPGWRYGRFSCRVRISYTSGYLDTYNAANPALNVYSISRVLVSPSFAFDLRRSLTLTCEVANVTNEHQVRYQVRRNLVRQERDNPTNITLGVKGRF